MLDTFPPHLPFQIRLNNWKNYTFASFLIPENSFLLIDNNGTGKTSLLTAIYSLFHAKAWPGDKLRSFLRSGQNFFGISSADPDFFFSGKINIQGRIIPKSSRPNPRKFPLILTYQPGDNEWLGFTRSKKLDYLDTILATIYGQEYKNSLDQFTKTLKAKQTLLRNYQDTGIEPDKNLINPLNQNLIQESLQLWIFRNKFFEAIEDKLSEFFEKINTSPENYKFRVEISNLKGKRSTFFDPFGDFATEELELLWQKEKMSGQVLFGAHRDDFDLMIDSIPAPDYLSRGEMRLLTVFILTKVVELIRSLGIKKDVWLLGDDMLNELDKEREKTLIQDLLTKINYFIITGTKHQMEGQMQEIPIFNLSQIRTS